MIILGVVIAILCFLWLCLLALLQGVRERAARQASISRKLPRVSHKVVETFEEELKQIRARGQLSQVGKDCIAELREEQPALFAVLLEILEQSETDDCQELTSGIVIYKLLKAQVEADVLDRSFRN